MRDTALKPRPLFRLCWGVPADRRRAGLGLHRAGNRLLLIGSKLLALLGFLLMLNGFTLAVSIPFIA